MFAEIRVQIPQCLRFVDQNRLFLHTDFDENVLEFRKMLNIYILSY